ncbi:MAG: hypothetical protein HY584_00195 [Candidatus Omnitrophica bacterium]|nr:hypothetical protein [Candidatus Omnitrophota bacterium]
MKMNKMLVRFLVGMIAIVFAGVGYAEEGWLVKQKKVSSDGQLAVFEGGALSKLPPPVETIAKVEPVAKLDPYGKVKDGRKERTGNRGRKIREQVIHSPGRPGYGSDPNYVPRKVTPSSGAGRPGFGFDPNYIPRKPVAPSGSGRPGYGSDPNYVPRKVTPSNGAGRPGLGHSVGRGKGKPEMLEPFGRVKDDRKEQTGNRGRPIR